MPLKQDEFAALSSQAASPEAHALIDSVFDEVTRWELKRGERPTSGEGPLQRPSAMQLNDCWATSCERVPIRPRPAASTER
jgi:hypothetical protein